MNNTITTKIAKITSLFCLVMLTCLLSRAQQTNNWYFGSAGGNLNTGIRIDFTSGSPVVSTCNPIRTEEGSSSISDASGNPLFYTDGITMWDASTNASFGGTMLGGSSSTQSGIIMPKPGTTNQWLVFTSGATGTNGINYYTVTGTGSPGISPFTLMGPTNLSPAGTVGEGLFVIGSTNPAYSFWVIARTADNGVGQVRAWPVSTAGVVGAMVTSNISGPSFTNVNFDQLIGTIKSNSCQNKLAFTYFNGSADIVSFDASTGMVKTDAQRIAVPAGQSYGLEFSPNDQYLYLTSLGGSTVYRYNINVDGLGNLLTGSVTSLTTTTGEAGQLQLGPNGVIYMANGVGSTGPGRYLSSITNPNTGGTFTAQAIDLQAAGITCGGYKGFSYRGLPTFPKALTITNPIMIPDDTSICKDATIPFKYTYAGFASTISWDFGDPGSGAANTSTSATPSHTYNSLGTFKAKVTITDNCARTWKDSSYITVTNAKVPAGIISCGTSSLTFTATGTVPADYPNYVWYDAATGGNVLGVGSPVTANYPSLAAAPTSVWVEVAGSASISNSGSNSIGPSTWPWSSGLSNSSQTFSVLADAVTIKNFQVLTRAGVSYGGNFTVTITNSASATVFTQTYNVTGSAGGTTYTVNLNTTLGKGNYTLSISGAAQWMMTSAYTGATNAGQFAFTGTSNTPVANFQYDYTNYTIVPTCTQRIKVDRKCLLVFPGDGTYCTGADIPLSYTFEGTAVSQTWSISPGVAGTDWMYVSPSTSTSVAPTVRFLTAGTYTITANVTDNTATVHSKFMTFTVIAGSIPAGTINCSLTSITLTATGTPSSDYPKYIWYDAATGGNILGVGGSVTWNNPDNASTMNSVWVEVGASASSSGAVTNVVGPPPSWLNGGSYQYHTRFDVLADHVLLNSFQIQPEAWPSGSCPSPTNVSFSIEIRNAANTVVFLKPYSGTVTCGTMNTIPVVADLVKGNGYRISLLSFASNAGSFLQIFNGFPVTQSGVATVNGPTANYTIMGNLSFTSNNFTVTHNCASRVRVDRLCTLPVELISFTGKDVNGKNYLNWITTSETNNHYFEVQRSEDGVNFVTIGKVMGHGTTTSIFEYQLVDYSPASGVNYYRLVQYDYDGKSTYSNIIKLYSNIIGGELFTVNPNPSTSSFQIRFSNLQGGQLYVYDVLGREISVQSIEEGTDKISIGADLSKGVYIVKYAAAGGVSTQRVVKE